MSIETKPLSLTINGKAVGPVDVPVGLPMLHFLHEYMDLTGTHFGCGIGECHACTIVVQNEDGTTTQNRTCIFEAHYFDGKSILTIEGHAQKDEAGNIVDLSPLQQAFVDNFAFQCGYCASGFVAGATVFIDGLKRQPVKREQLESAIETALNPHICRCTGYVRYYEAVRQVALDTPGCIVD